MKTVTRVIIGLVIVLLVGVSVLPGTAAPGTEAATAGAGVPLPVGDELSDEQLLAVEGELWWFVMPFLFGAVAGAGSAAIYENWFDEDYGIDRDDRRQIGFGAASGAIGGAAGAFGGFFPVR